MKALSLLLLVGIGVAQAESLSFDAAWQRAQHRSDTLAAARAAVASKALHAQGVEGAGGPSVAVSGLSYTYRAHLSVDFDPLTSQVRQISQALPLPGGVPASMVPTLPANYTLDRRASATSASLSAVWPLYLGGATAAVRGFAKAQQEEAVADADKNRDEVATLLVQRYFGAQLARRGAILRDGVLKNVEGRDREAEKMLAAGLISRLERLQTRTSLEDARRNALKAADDDELAATALARTLKATETVTPTTPLFVSSQPLPPLAEFVATALARHPGLAKVAAKREQATQLHAGQEALRKPQVFAFGQRQLDTANADWVAGIGVRWTLFESQDRDALAAATLKQVEQAEFSDAQARSDIALLVERNWRAVDQARRQFLATAAGVQLAQEILKLRDSGLRQGVSTRQDLIEAQLNAARIDTERAQAAYDYVVALANLLESCGQVDEFAAWAARADIRLESP